MPLPDRLLLVVLSLMFLLPALLMMTLLLSS
jgi:hypothetical protein